MSMQALRQWLLDTDEKMLRSLARFRQDWEGLKAIAGAVLLLWIIVKLVVLFV